MKIEFRGERIRTGGRDRICFAVPELVRLSLWEMVQRWVDKGIDTWHVVIHPPYKKRTTGEKSQNHHAWGHAGHIAMVVGETREKIMSDAKERAVSLGYPTYEDWEGKIVPISETEASTEEYSHVIEALHQIAAFLEIELPEDES